MLDRDARIHVWARLATGWLSAFACVTGPAVGAEPVPPDSGAAPAPPEPYTAVPPPLTLSPNAEPHRPAQRGTGGLVREGALLPNRRGRMVPAAGSAEGAEPAEGIWFFVFDPDAEGKAEPPMAILPCLRLNEMERAVESHPESVTLFVTGTSYVYEGRNWLLPRTYSVAALQDDAPAAPANAGDAPVDSTSGANPTVEALLGRAAGGASPVVPTPTSRGSTSSRAAGVDAASEGKLLREGATIVSRRGRVERGGSLGWSFAMDNDADRENDEPTTLGLLPCQNLEAMTAMTQRLRRPLVFTVTGTVYVYRGRNYLLPTVWQVEIDREGNLTSGQ